jgi:hypothetical protein
MRNAGMQLLQVQQVGRLTVDDNCHRRAERRTERDDLGEEAHLITGRPEPVCVVVKLVIQSPLPDLSHWPASNGDEPD